MKSIILILGLTLASDALASYKRAYKPDLTTLHGDYIEGTLSGEFPAEAFALTPTAGRLWGRGPRHVNLDFPWLRCFDYHTPLASYVFDQGETRHVYVSTLNIHMYEGRPNSCRKTFMKFMGVVFKNPTPRPDKIEVHYVGAESEHLSEIVGLKVGKTTLLPKDSLGALPLKGTLVGTEPVCSAQEGSDCADARKRITLRLELLGCADELIPVEHSTLVDGDKTHVFVSAWNVMTERSRHQTCQERKSKLHQIEVPGSGEVEVHYLVTKYHEIHARPPFVRK